MEKNTVTTSDEVWLVEKSLSLLKNDPYAAKSWLLTGRTLFPSNFQIQYQAYRMEKMQKNPKKVAVLLEEMLVQFPQEMALWDDIHQVIDLLQTDTHDDKNNFLKEVFDLLPAHLQCHVLLRVADTQTDVLQKCRLVMLVLQRYPDRVAEQGINLIDSLIAAEKTHHMTSPVNCYRKYLVCDVLPLVLKGSLQKTSHAVLLNWLKLSMEFYITYMTHPPSPDMLLSPKAGVAGGVSSRRISIQGVTDGGCYISNPWHCLLDTLKLISVHLGWNLHNIFTNPNHESVWREISSLYEHSIHGDLTQLFFGCLVLCFDCVLTYAEKVDPDTFAGTSCNTTPLVLVEGFKPTHDGTPEPKKKAGSKADHIPHITSDTSISGSKDIIQSFLVAVKSWQLLHSITQLQNDTRLLLDEWQADKWMWLHSFQVDYAIYQGEFKEALLLLQRLSQVRLQSQASPLPQLRNELQLASCYYCMKNLSKSCESILNLVASLSPHTSDQSAGGSSSPGGRLGGATPGQPVGTSGGAGARQLHLMSCNEGQIFSYCVHLLITCLKEKAFKSFQGVDQYLGHMIILLQYAWPQYEPVFSEVVDRIKKKGAFSYNSFFNYVVNIDILEEFAYMKSVEGGKVNLDILPISTTLIAQSRTMTRGVNKVVKEDFKSHMEKQVCRSSESVDTLIRSFFVDEKDTLQRNLL